MTLDLTSFRRAIDQLEEALTLVEGPLGHSNPSLQRHLRAAAIQAYEFTYELTVKTLRQYLLETEVSPEAAQNMTFVDIDRRGYELGLLAQDVTIWRNFRRDRGVASHTNNETLAEEVYRGTPALLEEAKYLLAKLEVRTGLQNSNG